MINLRRASLLSNIITKHISARNLTSEEVPTLLKHHLLNANDKAIWNDAYYEEYDLLCDLPCWYTISQKEFDIPKYNSIVLPSMAVATIKYDENGAPNIVSSPLATMNIKTGHHLMLKHLFST